MLKPLIAPWWNHNLFLFAQKTANVPAAVKVYINLQCVAKSFGHGPRVLQRKNLDISRHWWWGRRGRALQFHLHDLLFDLFDVHQVDLHLSHPLMPLGPWSPYRSWCRISSPGSKFCLEGHENDDIAWKTTCPEWRTRRVLQTQDTHHWGFLILWKEKSLKSQFWPTSCP